MGCVWLHRLRSSILVRRNTTINYSLIDYENIFSRTKGEYFKTTVIDIPKWNNVRTKRFIYIVQESLFHARFCGNPINWDNLRSEVVKFLDHE